MHPRPSRSFSRFPLWPVALLLAVACSNEPEPEPLLDDLGALADGVSKEVAVLKEGVTDGTVRETYFIGDVLAGAFGAPCAGNEDCDSGYCVPSDEGHVCTKVCVSDCPEGWSCLGVAVAGADLTFLCVPRASRLCEKCTSDIQCAGARCLQTKDGMRCTRPCQAPADCPAGFDCIEPPPIAGAAGNAKQCVPSTGLCDCGPSNAGETRPCERKNPMGHCVGLETCDPKVGWSPCTALEPAAETCNGTDDDCDGKVDDAIAPPTATCTVDGPAGSCPGKWSCDGAAGFVCKGAVPVVESCNYQDDDCDGVTDGGFVDAASGKYLSPEHCGVCGKSCLTLFPNGTGKCAGDGDVPHCVVSECASGYVKAGDSACVPIQASLCLPCASDAVCGVPGDLCLPLASGGFCGRSCGPTSVHGSDCPAGFTCAEVVSGQPPQCAPKNGSCDCGPGNAGEQRACQKKGPAGICLGLETCDAALGWVGCTATTPGDEGCNGKDDDCDGQTDEELSPPTPACAVVGAAGACPGTWTCEGATGFVCKGKSPEVETCNYQDDDCDGVADDGFVDATTGHYAANTDCGACGKSCAGLFPHAVAECSLASGAPECAVKSCDSGYYKASTVACLPAKATLCLPCETDASCGVPGDLCLALAGGKHCGRSCGPGSIYGPDCPTGYVCETSAGGAAQCVPSSKSCDCTPANVGLVRACASTNDFGTCAGVETCDGAGWSACSATTPAVESCNGKDDDCDGLIDDGPLPPLTPCAATAKDPVTGEDLTCPGVWTCPATAVPNWLCEAVTPSPEVCNGKDDDCDGKVDDGPAWTGLGTPCVVGKGECTDIGVLVCDPTDAKAPAVCNGVIGATAKESCNGKDDDCDGETDESLVGPACAQTDGVCAGATRPCGGNSGWLACSAGQLGPQYEPVELTCDGLDNDCDGFVDDDLPAHPCAMQGGACAGALAVCAGANGWLPCGAAEYGADWHPEETTCDNADDDCDGFTDETFKVDGKYTTNAHCGVCGVACEGALPHATATCDGTNDPPRCEVQTCASGYVKASEVQCVPADLGLCAPCGPGTTCPLPTAKCVTLTDGSYCLPPCDLAAPTCGAGTTCQVTTQGSVCVPATQACTCGPASVGLVRGCAETFTPPAGPPYPCFGTSSCTAAGWSSCGLPSESCNQVDDDCDGQVDEGFVNAAGTYADDHHCGKCGNDCTLLLFQGAKGACNKFVSPPVCSVSCTSTCFDVNANPSDGCECCDPAPIDLPDPQSKDANCDGIDGEKDGGIFVSKAGDDGNDGSYGHPKRTIQAGIDAAKAQQKRDVYVATGVYAESITLAASVMVYGGYSGDFKARSAVLYEVAIFGQTPTALQPGAVNGKSLVGGAKGSAGIDGLSVYGATATGAGQSSYGVYLRGCDASVRVTSTRVLAGSGGKGKRGVDGVDGADGLPGKPGLEAIDLYTTSGVDQHGCLATHWRPGGSGAVSACDGQSVAGGSGGNRVCPTQTGSGNDTTPPVASEAGAPGQGGAAAGGVAGRDVYHQAFQCLGYATFGSVEGGNGTDGKHGESGASGPGCGGPVSIVDGLVVPAVAGSGLAGLPGGGGGGGGSGAGAWVHTSCFAKGFGYDNLGGTGGGGGSAGCGGTPGASGTSGGAAFGIFVVFDVAPASIPELSGNVIIGGHGGDGGDGGNGGVGGASGAGGLGGAAGGPFEPPTPTYPSFEGGKGGNGGNGGHAGGGGGGCGGSAFGIFAHGASGLLLVAWKTGNTFASTGSGGDSGHGGFSLAAPGGNGAIGSAAATNF